MHFDRKLAKFIDESQPSGTFTAKRRQWTKLTDVSYDDVRFVLLKVTQKQSDQSFLILVRQAKDNIWDLIIDYCLVPEI